ncbi:MAG: rhodanese-related sulfurtransferase [Henriciella sp.]|nr:rhodanese-related sulfurtransferase [Henriciella sp.]
MTKIRVIAFYKFVRFDDPAALQAPLQEALATLGVKGTVLLATEGLNGTIAGPDKNMDAALAALKALPGCSDLDSKASSARDMPFLRLKVRLKSEIVTMGVPGTDPTCVVGNYVEPSDWNALIQDPDTVVIDTRNDYEVELGTFEGAIDPETTTFREFPEWFDAFKAKLEAEGRTPKVAMFCTGGIRCEKATSYVKSVGIDDVFHLQGGILKYLETVPEPESLWHGECFVFDDRVSVGHGLKQGDYQLCHGCRFPVSPADRAHPGYEEGVSCPHCADTLSDRKRAALRERQKQVALAKARGETHLGDEVVMQPRKRQTA